MSGFTAMVRHRIRANRMSMIAMTVLIAILSSAQILAFTTAFPAATRSAALGAFTRNGALRAIYGTPYDIATPAGWTAWRAMSNAAIIIAVWAAFVTVGALRGEEESGRAELALSQPQPRRRWFLAALTAITLEICVISVIMFAADALSGIPQGLVTAAQCVRLTLQLTLPALLFMAVGAVAAQLIGTAKAARVLAIAVVAASFLLRIPADSAAGWDWLRWVSPLGWVEELRPASGASPVAVVALLATPLVLVAVALPMLRRRDVGLGLLGQHDSRNPRRGLLRSPTQAAFRDEALSLAIWFAATLAVAALLGGLITSVLDFLHTNGAVARFLGPGFAINAFIAGTFSIFQLVAVLLATTMVVSARGEEASGRLELVLAMPRSRMGWLGGRMVLAACTSGVLAVGSALAMWATASLSGVGASSWGMIEAALNTLPLVILATGAAAALLAALPRAVGLMYAIVGALYLWDALGTVFKAPAWTLDVSPFHAIAAVPLQDFAWIPAAVISVLGVLLAAAAMAGFRHRDLAIG